MGKVVSLEFRHVRKHWWQTWLLPMYMTLIIPYFAWRTLVVNWDVWFGPIAYLADIYGIITTLLFLWLTRENWQPIFRPAKLGSKVVDVFIPTYNEPLNVLAPVIIGATKIEGVRQVLVGDDTNRLEVAEACKKMGVLYYPRTDNTHAKAGNMNNLLKHSDAELIVCLDADHIPFPYLLQRTLGYFDDPELAFVQSPQSFYNQDSFLYRKRHGKKPWSEQLMFYNCIQPSKNRWNSAFFVGTSAVLRRSAIDSVEGFATGTATEDIHTSLRLHAKGWKSLFIEEPLAYGLEAANFREFYRQRRRWAGGSLGLLLRSPDSPLWAKGLTLEQRLNYLSATLAHLQGVQKLLYFLVPVLTILTLHSPVHTGYAAYSILLIITTIVSLTATRIYSRGTYHILHTETYSLANMLAHLGGLWGIVKVQKKFKVSQKTIKRRERTLLKGWLYALEIAGLAGMGRGLWLWTHHQHNALVVVTTIILGLQAFILGNFLVIMWQYERRKAQPELSSIPHSMYTFIQQTYATSALES